MLAKLRTDTFQQNLPNGKVGENFVGTYRGQTRQPWVAKTCVDPSISTSSTS